MAEALIDPELKRERDAARAELAEIDAQLRALPPGRPGLLDPATRSSADRGPAPRRSRSAGRACPSRGARVHAFPSSLV